jgi:hypothetical protein
MILHLLNGRCRMVHDAAPTGRMIVFVHLHPTTRASQRLDVNFLAVLHYADRIFTDIRIHRAPDCVRCWGGRIIWSRGANY